MHTPGPWYVEVYSDGTTVESKTYTIAENVSNEDAALIAAAPDLLEACEFLIRHEENGDLESVDFEAIRQAIAKAVA